MAHAISTRRYSILPYLYSNPRMKFFFFNFPVLKCKLWPHHCENDETKAKHVMSVLSLSLSCFINVSDSAPNCLTPIVFPSHPTKFFPPSPWQCWEQIPLLLRTNSLSNLKSSSSINANGCERQASRLRKVVKLQLRPSLRYVDNNGNRFPIWIHYFVMML